MSSTAQSVPFVFCNVGREAYAIDATEIVTIERPDQLQPASPTEGQVGWFPTAEGGIPVYSLDRLLSRASKRVGDKQRVVFLKGEAGQWGLLINSLSPIIELPTDRISAVPEIAINSGMPLFRGVLRHSAHLILWLDIDRLYAAAVGDQVIEPSLSEPQPSEKALTAATVEEVIDPDIGLSLKEEASNLLLFSLPDQMAEVKDLTFCLSLTQVVGISNIPTMIPIPKGPSKVLGLTLWQDIIVPIIDLNYCAGLSKTAYMPSNPTSQFVVVRGFIPGQVVGFPAQSRLRALSLSTSLQADTQPALLKDGFACGVFALPQETLIVPDLKYVFAH